MFLSQDMFIVYFKMKAFRDASNYFYYLRVDVWSGLDGMDL